YRFACFVCHSPGDHTAFDQIDRYAFAYAMNGIFAREFSGDVPRRVREDRVSSRRQPGQFEITVDITGRRRPRPGSIADSMGGDSYTRGRLTVRTDDAACNLAFAL